MLKISVVVPVYNPGRYILPNIESLVGQTMPSSEYEVIYVDDGSTDETPAVLDSAAASHSHVRVIHQENSGWPGKPRNVGIDLAQGEYILFVDHDDTLADNALERLYAIGSRNNSDIVFGKYGGTFPGPNHLYRHTIEQCSVETFPLYENYMIHRLFRRDFLLKHGLRFPEGKFWLEDQLFASKAYLLAERVSVLAGYPSYYWWRRDDGGNNGLPFMDDVHGFYQSISRVIDAIVEHTEEGELRNRVLLRTYRFDLLRAFREPLIQQQSEELLHQRLEVVRKLVLEKFSSGEVQSGMAPLVGLRATLLEAGSLDGLRTLADRCREYRPQVTLTGLEWRNSCLVGKVRARFVHSDGTPLYVVRKNDRYLLDPRLTDGLPGIGDGWEVSNPLAGARAEARLHDREGSIWWWPSDSFEASLEPVADVDDARQAVIEGTFTIDPMDIADDGPLRRGLYDVSIGVEALGFGGGPRIGADRAPGVSLPPPALMGDGPLVVAPYWTNPQGQLSLDVAGRGGTLMTALAASPLEAARLAEGRLRVAAPVVIDAGATPLGFETSNGSARIESSSRGAVLVLPPIASSGRLSVRLALPGTTHVADVSVLVPRSLAALMSLRRLGGRVRRRLRRLIRRSA